MTLVLTYHAVEEGPEPLCVPPGLFAEHVRAIVESGLPVLTVSELATALRAGSLPERATSITFDDGYASVVRHAAPILERCGLRATVFCVAGHLSGLADWPTQAEWAPRLAIAGAAELSAVAAAGWEIGSHGVQHAPLSRADAGLAYREVVESRRLLEGEIDAKVTSFAWPYGASPAAHTSVLIADSYDAACAAGPGAVRAGSDPFAIPRVDVHYVRSPERLRRALAREPRAYLAVRRGLASVKRRVRPDYVGTTGR